jgi:hypothetical protein
MHTHEGNLIRRYQARRIQKGPISANYDGSIDLGHFLPPEKN